MMKRTRIVPRAVFGLAAVGVVPVCVSLANCGGANQEMMSPVAATGFTAAPSAEPNDASAQPMLGVAAPAFEKH